MTFQQRVTRFISNMLDDYHLHASESMVTNVLAVIVGILVGYGAVAFRWMIGVIGDFWDNSGTAYFENWFPFLGKYACPRLWRR